MGGAGREGRRVGASPESPNACRCRRRRCGAGLRVFAGRLHAVWAWFIEVAVTAGVDVTVPDATGRWRGALIAVATAAVAIRSRFGAVVGARPGDAVSGGGVLQRWSPSRAGMAAAASGGADQHESALTIGGATWNSRRRDRPAPRDRGGVNREEKQSLSAADDQDASAANAPLPRIATDTSL